MDRRPVLILGAGINGAALARELVLNRVPVWLVDTADIASGATAYSSRLIHGGLRYLEYGEFDLVRESLRERERWLKLAPHWVRPLELQIPVSSRWGGFAQAAGRVISRWAGPAKTTAVPRGSVLIRTGLWMYDIYAHGSSLPKHRSLRAGAAEALPVDATRYRELCSYYDAQVTYPERFVIGLLEDARFAATENDVEFQVLNYHQAQLAGTTAELSSSVGQQRIDHRIEPAAVVNATGAWVDRTLQRLDVPSRRLIGGTKGSHIFTFQSKLREALSGRAIYAEASDGRPFFITPLAGVTLIGTTDLPFDAEPATAVVSSSEIDYLLENVNAIFPQVALSRTDVDFHYSGVRPLAYVGAGSPAATTRRHWVVRSDIAPVALFSLVGGKLTTCRSLAEQAARMVLQEMGVPIIVNSRDRPLQGFESSPCETGAEGFSTETVTAVCELLGNHSLGALQGLAGVDRDLLPGLSLPRGVVRRIIRTEWVQTLDDLVERRLMLLYHQHLTLRCLREIAELLSQEKKMEAADLDRQVSATVKRLRSHFGKSVAVD